MSEPTYGELLNASEQSLIAAALSARDKLANAQTASAAAQGHADLIRAIRANAELFTRLPTVDDKPRHRQVSEAISELTRVLDTFGNSSRLSDVNPVPSGPRPRLSTGPANDWSTAAHLLHAAADTLSTHIGPHQAHRTADAKVLDDPDTQHAALGRLAQMALTTGIAQQRLALRIHEAAVTHHGGASLREFADRMLDTHAPLTIAAANVTTEQTNHRLPDHLASLRAAPLLRPTRTADPIAAARQSFDRIRLLAHRQARGGTPAGIDAIRVYATTAALAIVHARAIAAAASVASRRGLIDPLLRPQLKQLASMLADAQMPWLAVTTATDRIASLRRSPPLLAHELDVFAKNLTLLTRDGNKWRDVDGLIVKNCNQGRLLKLASCMASRLHDLARASSVVTNELYAHGDLLVPTREREDLDHPYRWAPISTARISALQNANVTAGEASETVIAVTHVLTCESMHSPRSLRDQRPTQVRLPVTSNRRDDRQGANPTHRLHR